MRAKVHIAQPFVLMDCLTYRQISSTQDQTTLPAFPNTESFSPLAAPQTA